MSIPLINGSVNSGSAVANSPPNPKRPAPAKADDNKKTTAQNTDKRAKKVLLETFNSPGARAVWDQYNAFPPNLRPLPEKKLTKKRSSSQEPA